MGYVIQNGDDPSTPNSARGSARGVSVAKRLRMLRIKNLVITGPKGQRLTYAELEALAAKEKALAKVNNKKQT